MSYPIIFETKFAIMPSGNIIHFSLQGCNNDTCGRNRVDFLAQVYTPEEIQAKIKKFTDMVEDRSFELKIGSRWCSCYDYGMHLQRMLKRAELWNDFIQKRSVQMTYDHMYVDVKNPEEVEDIICTKGNDVIVYISRKYKRMKIGEV